MTTIEIVAAVFGFLSVAFYIGRSFWSWPTGLIQVILYVGVFLQSKLYADMILHLFYIVLQCYGWWAWYVARTNHRNQASDGRIRVRVLSKRGWILCSVCILAMTIVFAEALRKWTDAALPIPDSFVAAMSIVAQVLLARRFLDNWLIWIAVDVVGIGLFAARGLYPTTILYVLFLGMSVVGFVHWREALRADERRVGVSS